MKRQCEHSGCSETDIQQYSWAVPVNGRSTVWLCLEHAIKTGFCVWCQTFGAGAEDYDFSPMEGYHHECYNELRAELGELDDDYDEDGAWDFYPAGWYDPDMDVADDGDTPTHTYIGPDGD